MNKEVRQLVTALERIEEVEIRDAGSGHLVVMKAGQFVTTLPSTPSDSRWKANTLATLRRAGITPATRPEKLSRPPKTAKLETIRRELIHLRDKRQVAEFARFMQQLGEIRGLRIYSNINSAESSLGGVVREGASLSPWAHRLVSDALVEWRRRQSPEEQPVESTPEPVQELVTGTRLVVNLSKLAAKLAEFGIEVEVR